MTNEFLATLNEKDKHYVHAMKDMTNHIDELIKQMKVQFVNMRESYASQLSGIEEEFLREREALLARNGDEIKLLFATHKKTEEYFQQQRHDDEEEQAEKLEKVRSEDANNQADQKIKLEKEMQILEKCMEDMKAVYKLNEEKLDFNKKVLNERKNVNQTHHDNLRIKRRNF